MIKLVQEVKLSYLVEQSQKDTTIAQTVLIMLHFLKILKEEAGLGKI